jgi:aminoglycoside 6-adenylyltransferase
MRLLLVNIIIIGGYMRTEQEMIDLILNIAKMDERIYAIYMNGSRTNSNIVKDIFQDFDIVYVVSETKTFREDKAWIDKFGKRLYMQYPEENSYYQNDIENCYGWLIQFTDGNRLDLHVCTLKYVLENIHKDKLCKILLDKNKYLPNIEEPTDIDY